MTHFETKWSKMILISRIVQWQNCYVAFEGNKEVGSMHFEAAIKRSMDDLMIPCFSGL